METVKDRQEGHNLLALADEARTSVLGLYSEFGGCGLSSSRELLDLVLLRIETLYELLANRERQLDAVDNILADRLNNLLMIVQTAHDLLCAENGSARVSGTLGAALASGRIAVERARQAINQLR